MSPSLACQATLRTQSLQLHTERRVLHSQNAVFTRGPFMSIRLNRGRRSLPVILCVVTLISVGVLLVWDIVPALFPANAHDILAALPLAMIACACLVYEAVRRPSRSELIKAILLACAFLFWAANQLWPTLRQATLFNDLAIALFVFDVFLAMTSRPDPIS